MYLLVTNSFSQGDPIYENEDSYNSTNQYSWENDPRRLTLTPTVSNLTLKIDFNNGTILVFTNVTLTDRYTTVFDLTAFHSTIKYKLFRFGASAYFYITEINGLTENLGQAWYWQYWVDGVYTSIGANGYQLEDHDVVEWRYGYNSLQN